MSIIDRLKGYLQDRKNAYMITFSEDNQSANAVLRDLSKFCRANKSTFLPDSRAHAVLEGRREVWLRIQDNLNLSQDELYDLYGKE